MEVVPDFDLSIGKVFCNGKSPPPEGGTESLSTAADARGGGGELTRIMARPSGACRVITLEADAMDGAAAIANAALGFPIVACCPCCDISGVAGVEEVLEDLN